MLYARISVSSLELLQGVEDKLGADRWYVVDALIRSFSPDGLMKRVSDQQIQDGLARAGWERGKRR